MILAIQEMEIKAPVAAEHRKSAALRDELYYFDKRSEGYRTS